MALTAGTVAAMAFTTAAGAAATAATQGGGGRPQPLSYQETTRDALQAQVDLAPALLQAEQEFRPQYIGLDVAGVRQSLLGREAGQETIKGRVVEQVPGEEIWMPITEETPEGATVIERQVPPGAGFSGKKLVRMPTTNQEVFREKTVPVQESEGLLGLYGEEIGPAVDELEAESLQRRRTSEIEALERLGPRAVEAYRASDPQQAALLDELNQQVLGRLEAGDELTPAQSRRIHQDVRGGQAARGFGYGPADVDQEAIARYLGREETGRQRRQDAYQLISANQATGLDPTMMLFDKPSTMAQGNQFMQQGYSVQGSAGPRLFNPESQMAQDIVGANYNAQYADYIGGKNRRSAMFGSLIGAGGNIAGGYLAGGGGR